MWTLEKKGEKPDMNVDWDEAAPTPTHMALARLVEAGKVEFQTKVREDFTITGLLQKCLLALSN